MLTLKIFQLLIDGEMREHPVWNGYFVTEDGEVYSYWRLGKYPVIDYNKPPRKLSLQTDRNGYQSVQIERFCSHGSERGGHACCSGPRGGGEF